MSAGRDRLSLTAPSRWIAALAVALTCAFSPCVASADAPGAQAFFSHPQTLMARPSPSGEFVAVISRADGTRLALYMAPTDDFSQVKPIVEASNTDVANVVWINENRLLVVAGALNAGRTPAMGNVFAIDRNGGNGIMLIEQGANAKAETLGAHILDASYFIMAPVGDGSDDVIVGKRILAGDGALAGVKPYRLNTRTLELTSLVRGAVPEHAVSWLFDQNGEPRVLTSIDNGRQSVFLRAPNTQTWQLMGESDALSAEFTPEFLGAGDILYVSAAKPNGETALYRLDLATRVRSSLPVIDLPGFDYNGVPVMDRNSGRVLGVRYETDAGGTAWFDARMKAWQAAIDKVLSGTYNAILCIDCLGAKTLIVESSSDRVAPRFYIFEKDRSHLLQIGSSDDDVDPRDLGVRDFVRFAARDGLLIPMYVTHPPSKKNGPWPTIVWVHDGPFTRGGWWEGDDIAQFLASRGYLVLEPDYRGSKGFGTTLFRAGFRQIGLGMQDDLVDAAHFAIARGLADANRIGIAGDGFGGYAALIGLAASPEVFRAGFARGALPDIQLLFSPAWQDSVQAPNAAELTQLVGDPLADAAKWASLSAVANAAKITQPLLLAYGGEDRKVPLARASELHDALSAANRSLLWLIYPQEGHAWHSAKDEIDYFTHVEKFLDTHLKNLALQPRQAMQP